MKKTFLFITFLSLFILVSFAIGGMAGCSSDGNAEEEGKDWTQFNWDTVYTLGNKEKTIANMYTSRFPDHCRIKVDFYNNTLTAERPFAVRAVIRECYFRDKDKDVVRQVLDVDAVEQGEFLTGKEIMNTFSLGYADFKRDDSCHLSATFRDNTERYLTDTYFILTYDPTKPFDIQYNCGLYYLFMGIIDGT